MKYAIAGVSVVILAIAGIAFYLHNGHLSRAEAKKKLNNLVSNPDLSYKLIHFHIGMVAGACSGVSSDYDTVEESVEYPLLSDIGYLSVQSVKKHVWKVALTEKGEKAMRSVPWPGEPYGHTTGVDCDQWQVSLPIYKYDHFDVTGILEEGKHAKVDVALIYVVTPVGLEVRKVAEKFVYDNQRKKFGEKLGRDFTSGQVESLLGDEVARMAATETKFVRLGSITFDKYDDGWKPDLKSIKDEK